MANHSIRVTVGSTSIDVEPETLVMTSSDEVRWTGADARQFSIVFDGDGPFADPELAYDAATHAQRPRSRGRFKYSVVSAEDPMLRLDPVIIVEEPPTDPTP